MARFARTLRCLYTISSAAARPLRATLGAPATSRVTWRALRGLISTAEMVLISFAFHAFLTRSEPAFAAGNRVKVACFEEVVGGVNGESEWTAG